MRAFQQVGHAGDLGIRELALAMGRPDIGPRFGRAVGQRRAIGQAVIARLAHHVQRIGQQAGQGAPPDLALVQDAPHDHRVADAQIAAGIGLDPLRGIGRYAPDRARIADMQPQGEAAGCQHRQGIVDLGKGVHGHPEDTWNSENDTG